MQLNEETFKRSAIILSKAKKSRELSRAVVRSQEAPEGENMVASYFPKKKGKPTKGYEGWVITEMPNVSESGWRQVRVRMDIAGTCRFDLAWNGDRFADSTGMRALQAKNPKMAKTTLFVMQGHEAMRHVPR